MADETVSKPKPRLYQKPHLVALVVNNIPEPRGKVFRTGTKWVFLRNVKRAHIIRIYDGFSIDMALLRYLMDIDIDEIHYHLIDDTPSRIARSLYITTPESVHKYGYRWGRGARWQYVMPRRYWNREDQMYEVPLIPDWTVHVIGPVFDGKTGYGPGTEGGTIFRDV